MADLPALPAPEQTPPKKLGGPVILFIHDWFSPSEKVWEGQIEYFSRYHSCHTFELIGHGAGRWVFPGKGESIIEANLVRLKAAIQEFKGPVHIVAHGISSIIALRAARDYPKRIKSLVLINCRISFRSERFFKMAGSIPILAVPFMLISRDPLGTNEPLIGRLFARLKMLSVSFAAKYMHDLWQIDVISDLEKVQTRVAIIVGARDPLINMSDVEKMGETIPDAHLIQYRDLGHSPHLEEPFLINQAIDDFIKKPSGIFQHIRYFFKNLFGG